MAAAHRSKRPAVVYFPPGNFRLFEAEDFGTPPVEITRSNVVLKGSGVGTTQLEFAEAPLLGGACIRFRSSSGKDDYWRGDKKLAAKIVKPIDIFTVEVTDASELAPGMRVNLNPQMDPSKPKTAELFAPHNIPSGIHARARSKNGKLTDLFELHEVTKVEGKRVTFGEPIHLELDYCENIVLYRIDHIIEQCGIEDLTLRGGFRELFKHHNGTRYSEDYRMIELDRVFHSWARRIRIRDFSSGIGTWLCGFNTFLDIVLEGNAGHNSVTAKSSTETSSRTSASTATPTTGSASRARASTRCSSGACSFWAWKPTAAIRAPPSSIGIRAVSPHVVAARSSSPCTTRD